MEKQRLIWRIAAMDFGFAVSCVPGGAERCHGMLKTVSLTALPRKVLDT